MHVQTQFNGGVSEVLSNSVKSVDNARGITPMNICPLLCC